MSLRPGEIEKLLERLERDGIESLATDEVERLEAALATDPQAAARVGQMAAGGAAWPLPEGAGPSESQWESVWREVDRALVRRQVERTWQRRWQGLSAMAACALLVLAWRLTLPGGGVEPLRVARDVEVNRLEVFGEATSFVLETGGSDGFSVIWVMEDEGA